MPTWTMPAAPTPKPPVLSDAGQLFGRDIYLRDDYVVTPAVVTAGWDNEQRAGARVEETRMRAGARKRTLSRAAQEARS